MNKIDFENIDRPEIPVCVVKNLIATQFPQWTQLSIRPVEKSGWDNRTFHLGDEMLIRMPSAERYVHQVSKEHKWLPILSKSLSTPIPEPIALGCPSIDYPFPWSIYRWIDGETSEALAPYELELFANDIAGFLRNLYEIDTKGAPLAGPPFYRGTPPIVYDGETRSALSKLGEIVDVDACIKVWESALTSKWESRPVWFHGDFSPQNILVNNGRLAAVIDFGSSRVGDPACDLVIAWTLLDDKSREIFRSAIGLDENTWARARGWGLWKALITLAPLEDKTCEKAIQQNRIIERIVADSR